MSVRDTPASRSHADNVEKTRRNGSPDEKPSGSISAMRPSVRTSRTERRGLAALMGSGPPRSSAAKPRTDRLRPERADRHRVSFLRTPEGAPVGRVPPPRQRTRQRRASDTDPTPESPIASAEARDRSMIRPWAEGPRSLMRTMAERPVLRWVTLTRVPKGRERCAAVRLLVLKISPFAVRRPWKPGPYQDACPLWIGCSDDPAGSDPPGSAAPAVVKAAKAIRAAAQGSIFPRVIAHSLVISKGAQHVEG